MDQESIVNAQTDSHTRLHGKWLFSARLAWIAIAILATIMHIASLPVAFDLLRTPCYQEPCDTPFQTATVTESALQEKADLKSAWQSSIWESTVWLLTLGVALLIFWRRSDDWMAHLASIMLVTILAPLSPWPEMLADAQPLWYWPRALLGAIGLASAVGLFYLFPDGRFVPRWTRWLAIVLLVIIGVLAAMGASLLAGFPIFVAALATGTVFQIYRYRRVSSPIQRQQTKWVVLGILGMVIPMLVTLLVAFLNPSLNPLLNPGPRSLQADNFFGMMVTFGMVIPLCFLPVTLAFSLLRYRLWDVDILINRTLVYGVLTTTVVGLYVLIVGGSGILFQMHHNLSSTIIAILLIAFLFTPLRLRLQDVANRLVPVPQAVVYPSPPILTSKMEQAQNIATTESISRTVLHGRWLLIARLAWITMFIALTMMYVFGFLAVRETLSTVCEDGPCTLGAQIQQTDSGERVMKFGPPFGYVDRLRSEQVNVLKAFGLTLDQYGWLGALQMGIPILMYLLIALGLFWRKSYDWTVLFISVMIATFPLQNTPLPLIFAMHHPSWEWSYTVGRMVAVACFFAFPLIFPTGQFVPRWTRWMAWFVVASTIIVVLFGDSIQRNILGNISLIEVWAVAIVGTGVYAQLYRYFRVATPVERQQIKWVIVGIAVFLITAEAVLRPWDSLLTSHLASMDFAQALAQSTLIDVIFTIVSLFIPVSIAISVLRYRLWDIDIIINRTLVYGALTAGIVALYIFLVGALSLVSQTTGNLLISLLATGLIAFLFQPLRERLQGNVNRLLYGDRDDPYAALSRLGKRLESSIAPEAVFPTIVTTVREALKLPYTAIYLKQDENDYKIVAESASPSLRIENGKIRVPGMEREGQCIPLVHQGETLGYLVLGPRTPNEAFSSSDLRLVDDLAPQVGVAVHAMRLTADLQRSREKLVLAREEERRRLRRDLHDDLAPTLATLGLTASTAVDLIATNPTKATALVKELQTEIRATVGNIRRLVYDLRPPTLDELGLLAAVRERAAQYSNAPDGFQVTVDAPAELPALPAAVEVATYRIVQEALENVSKHSQAHQCAIRFANHDGLELEITDDGIGLPAKITPGVGMRSMRERAEELGGSCVIESGKNGSTRVFVCLPIGEFNGSIAHPDRG